MFGGGGIAPYKPPRILPKRTGHSWPGLRGFLLRILHLTSSEGLPKKDWTLYLSLTQSSQESYSPGTQAVRMLLVPGFRGTQEANHFRGSHFDTYSFACAGVLWRSVVSTMEPPRVTGQAQKLHWFKFRCWEPPPCSSGQYRRSGLHICSVPQAWAVPKKESPSTQGSVHGIPWRQLRPSLAAMVLPSISSCSIMEIEFISTSAPGTQKSRPVTQ